MVESAGAKANLPPDPKSLHCQVYFKKLSDEILAHKSKTPLTCETFPIHISHQELIELHERMYRSSWSDLMLPWGSSLSAPQPNEYYPDLKLVVDKDTASRLYLTHWNWEQKKYRRIEPDSPEGKIEVAEFPGEYDWARQIDLEFWYKNGEQEAAQVLGIYDLSQGASYLPRLHRFCISPEYAEMGYEGHNHKGRQARNGREVIAFADLAREIFAKRFPPKPPRPRRPGSRDITKEIIEKFIDKPENPGH